MTDEKLIGINTLFLIPGKVGGTEIFLMNLVSELSKIKTSHKYLIYANEENAYLFRGLPKNIKVINTHVNASNRVNRIFWEQFILPIVVFKDRIDVLHSPGYTSPVLVPCKKITTIFDLNYHFHPEDFSFMERFIYSVLIPLSAYTSDKIIVHSNKSKSDMVNVLHVKPEKIQVIYAGVSEEFKKDINYKKSLDFAKKFNIKPPFILANSTSHPHKNLGSLMLAYIEMIKDNKFKHNLVLIGIKGKAFSGLEQLVQTNHLVARIQFTNMWLKNSDTKYFYRLADVFVQPSLYEGFGLPLVEALAVGTPIIASKYSCIPEIVGSAAIIIDTKRPELISKNVLALLEDKNKRERLSWLGKERSKMYSWTTFGTKIYNLYRNV